MNKKSKMLIMLLLVLFNRIVLADETIESQGDLFIPNKSMLHRINEQNGRAGVLIVSGSFVTSPCTLKTNEVELPLASPKMLSSTDRRNALELVLSACADGSLYSSPVYAKVFSQMDTGTALISAFKKETGIGPNMVKFYGGNNKIIFYLSEYQQQININRQQENNDEFNNNSTMELKLNYQ